MTHGRWIKFLRNYGPIPTNDNMYDETIVHAMRKHQIEPIALPIPKDLDEIFNHLTSSPPVSVIITGTAGDGKTFRCREIWRRLGGDETSWLKNNKKQVLQHNGREVIFIKDLSELQAEESASFLAEMALDLTSADSNRSYLMAANHGQLLEKLRLACGEPAVERMRQAVEEMLFGKGDSDPGLKLHLLDLSRRRSTQLVLGEVIDAIAEHAGWSECGACPANLKRTCPIQENRTRLVGENGNRLLRARLEALIEICVQNGAHFPVRQLLLLVTNALLGHPDARDRLMTCDDAIKFAESGDLASASVYRNVFGENLTRRRAEQTEIFQSLNAFGIGGETSNAADNLLVYGADDPTLKSIYEELVQNDQIYGATENYRSAQQAYLESYDENAKDRFLGMLRTQRQRLFFTLPERHEVEFSLWDLTVFRYAGLFLRIFIQLKEGQQVDRRGLSLIVRGLNRLFTGLLLQNHDNLFLATSGSLSQSKRSPLLDESISVPRHQGEELSLVCLDHHKIAIQVKVSRGNDPGPVILILTPTRFEFLGRVAEGALPSSFSLECQEDLLAFKAKLLNATERRRELDNEAGEDGADEIALRFIDLASDGIASPRRVTVRI